jgi:hypothetical protein
MKIASKSTDTRVEDTIRQLARQHGIDSSRCDLDDWTDKIGELSGQDDGQADEVEQLLINLRRAKLITPEYSRELFADYMDSKFGYR